MRLGPKEHGYAVSAFKDEMLVHVQTMQEHLLSPRCVFFTSDEVHFICPKGEMREAYEIVEPSHETVRPEPPTWNRHKTLHELFQGPGRQAGTLSTYIDLVRDFTGRDLTHHGDRADAFGAILTRFWRYRAPENPLVRFTEACIPFEYFFPVLGWHIGLQGQVPCATVRRVLHDTRMTRYLPSWSWIGWAGDVDIRPGLPAKASADDPPQFTAKALDEFNIVIVAEDATLLPEWLDLSSNSRCSNDTRPVIVHVQLPMLQVRLRAMPYKRYISEDSKFYDILPAWPEEIDAGYKVLGYTRLDPELATARGSAHVYDLVYIPGYVGTDRVLLDQEGEHHVRVSHNCKLRDAEYWGKHASMKYIKWI